MEHPAEQWAAHPYTGRAEGNEKMGLLLEAEVGRDIEGRQSGQPEAAVWNAIVESGNCKYSTGRFTVRNEL